MRKLLGTTLLPLVSLIAVGALLRLYRIGDYIRFLGDEGRDALVVKRMIVEHDWTLLGPNASVGGFYTGPIYYYFMLPFLWLSKLDPIGPAVMSALFGLLAIGLIYYFCRLIFNPRVALVAAAITTLSPKFIEISRFSWNPNPIPVFALIVVISLYLSFLRKKSYYVFFAGLALGIMIQLHYSGLVFVAVMAPIVLLILPLRKLPLTILFATLGFVAGESLFLVFEARHGFPNTRTVLEFFTRRDDGATISVQFDILGSARDVLRRLYETVIGTGGIVVALLATSSLVALITWVISQRGKLADRAKVVVILSWLLMGTLGTTLYRGQLLDHYFIFQYPLVPIFIALLIDRLFRLNWTRFVCLAILILVFYLEISHLFIWSNPNFLVRQTKEVDKLVLDLAGERPYNFALIAPGNSDHAYRYFLEIQNRKPVVVEPPETDPMRNSITDQLIVVCEQRDCSPLGYPLWEVAGFGRAEIVDTVIGPAGIKIFKLIHYTGT